MRWPLAEGVDAALRAAVANVSRPNGRSARRPTSATICRTRRHDRTPGSPDCAASSWAFRDLNRSSDFYQKVWGLEEIATEGDAIYLRGTGAEHHVVTLRRAAQGGAARRPFLRLRPQCRDRAARQGEGVRHRRGHRPRRSCRARPAAASASASRRPRDCRSRSRPTSRSIPTSSPTARGRPSSPTWCSTAPASTSRPRSSRTCSASATPTPPT